MGAVFGRNQDKREVHLFALGMDFTLLLKDYITLDQVLIANEVVEAISQKFTLLLTNLFLMLNLMLHLFNATTNLLIK